MSTLSTAPERAETTDSDGWAWRESDDHQLIAEIEEFLASVPVPNTVEPRTTTLTTRAQPVTDSHPTMIAVQRPPRRIPAPEVGATERAPPPQPKQPDPLKDALNKGW